jgi:hypothetical protein
MEAKDLRLGAGYLLLGAGLAGRLSEKKIIENRFLIPPIENPDLLAQ